jgi:hypothetical protein
MDPMGRNVNHSNSGVFLKYWFTSLQGDAWPPPGVVEDVMKKNNLGTAFYVRFLGKFGWIHSDSILQFPSIFHPFSIHLVVHVVAFLGTTWGVAFRRESQRVPTQAVQNNTDSWRMQDHAEPWLPIAQCYVYILWYR